MDSERSEAAEDVVDKEPIIKHVGDVSFVGVAHDTDLSSSGPQKPSQRVLDVLQQSEYLLMEGIVFPTLENTPYLNYEVVAASYFEGKGKKADVHILEEDVDYAGLAEQYGLDRKHYLLFENYLYAHSAFDAFLKENDPQDLQSFKESVISSIAQRLSRNVPEEEAQLIARRVVDADVSLLQQGDEDTRNLVAGVAWYNNNHFLSPIRDYEVLYPKIQEYDATLSGKKTVVIGSSHVPNLVSALERGSMDAPPTWETYLKGLDVLPRRAYEAFDRVVVQGKKEKPWRRFRKK